MGKLALHHENAVIARTRPPSASTSHRRSPYSPDRRPDAPDAGGEWRGELRTHSKTELAEREGFEPSVHFWRTHTFQACSFNRSDTSPRAEQGSEVASVVQLLRMVMNETAHQFG